MALFVPISKKGLVFTIKCSFPANVLDLPEVIVTPDVTSVSHVEFNIDLLFGESARPRIATLCALEQLSSSTQRSMLACLQAVINDENEREVAHRHNTTMATVQTELSKDGGSLVKAVEQFWKQQYESRWLGHSLQADNFTSDDIYANTVHMLALAPLNSASVSKSQFAAGPIPFRVLGPNESPYIPTLAQLMEPNSAQFTEIFELIARRHPKHLQHLRILHTVERKFAKTLDLSYMALERAHQQLRLQQQQELDLITLDVMTQYSDASSFNEMDSTPVDMNQMAVLVGQHEKQQQIVEQQWQTPSLVVVARNTLGTQWISNVYTSTNLNTDSTQLNSSEPPWSLPPSADFQRNSSTRFTLPPLPPSTSLESTEDSTLSAFGDSAGPFSILAGSSNARGRNPDITSIRNTTDPVQTDTVINVATADQYSNSKLIEIESHLVWLGGQRKIQFRVRLLVGDLMDLLSCDYTDALKPSPPTSIVPSPTTIDKGAGAAPISGPSPVLPCDPLLIVRRSALLHSLYADNELVGVVLPHDSRSLFELAPLTSVTIGLRDTQLTEKHSESVLNGDNNKSTSDSNVDSDGEDILVDQTDALQCLSSHPSAWRCGTASHRARALCSTVNRYTDAHFTSLSHQVEHILAARFVSQRKRLRREHMLVEAEQMRITNAISAEKQSVTPVAPPALIDIARQSTAVAKASALAAHYAEASRVPKTLSSYVSSTGLGVHIDDRARKGLDSTSSAFLQNSPNAAHQSKFVKLAPSVVSQSNKLIFNDNVDATVEPVHITPVTAFDSLLDRPFVQSSHEHTHDYNGSPMLSRFDAMFGDITVPVFTEHPSDESVLDPVVGPGGSAVKASGRPLVIATDTVLTAMVICANNITVSNALMTCQPVSNSLSTNGGSRVTPNAINLSEAVDHSVLLLQDNPIVTMPAAAENDSVQSANFIAQISSGSLPVKTLAGSVRALPMPDFFTVRAGDFVCTRHANLREAHVLYHLMGARHIVAHHSVASTDTVNVDDQGRLLKGLRHCIETADGDGVVSLAMPCLLSGTYTGTRHSVPVAIQSELDLIFRSVRSAVTAIAQRRGGVNGGGGSVSSLYELRLVLPMTTILVGGAAKRGVSNVGPHVLHGGVDMSTIIQSNLVQHARASFGECFGV